MQVWLGTPRQKLAAGTALVMTGLCLFDYRNEFDMPHLHLEAPVPDFGSACVSGTTTNTASVLSYVTFDRRMGP